MVAVVESCTSMPENRAVYAFYVSLSKFFSVPLTFLPISRLLPPPSPRILSPSCALASIVTQMAARCQEARPFVSAMDAIYTLFDMVDRLMAADDAGDAAEEDEGKGGVGEGHAKVERLEDCSEQHQEARGVEPRERKELAGGVIEQPKQGGWAELRGWVAERKRKQREKEIRARAREEREREEQEKHKERTKAWWERVKKAVVQEDDAEEEEDAMAKLYRVMSYVEASMVVSSLALTHAHHVAASSLQAVARRVRLAT